jgi:hypothetical protein
MSTSTDPDRRARVAVAAGCGLVSAAACLVVFGMLSKDQVEGPYDGGDLTIGIFVAPLVAGAAAVANAAIARRWTVHAALPIVLWLTILLGIGASGGQRNNAETGVLWAVAALLAHLVLAVPRRVVAAVAVVAVGGAALGVTAAAQHRWRTQNFARVGVPAYLPEVPGYHLAGAYAGRSNLILWMQADGGGPEGIDVWISRSRETVARCPAGGDERWVNGSRLGFCLPEGSQVIMSPGWPERDLSGLLPSVRLQRVEMGALAEYPDRGTEREAD